MITAITIWFIGWLFMVGVGIEESEGDHRKFQLWMVIALIFLWPVLMGTWVSQNVSDGEG